MWVQVVFLYIRVLQILTMSKKIGPFVNMIVNMLNDFRNFLVIMAIFWVGICLAFVFFVGDTPQAC